jgi:hypothetical protein
VIGITEFSTAVQSIRAVVEGLAAHIIPSSCNVDL